MSLHLERDMCTSPPKSHGYHHGDSKQCKPSVATDTFVYYFRPGATVRDNSNDGVIVPLEGNAADAQT